MKKLMLSMAITVFTLGSAWAAPEAKVIFAKFHADWCGSCQMLAPTVKELKQEFEGQDVAFVTFDKTDNATNYKSAILASQLGLVEVFKATQKTGTILLIDAQSKQVISKFNKTNSKEEMAQSIKKALE